jgi:hypothetical protein
MAICVRQNSDLIVAEVKLPYIDKIAKSGRKHFKVTEVATKV